ncbi:Ubiquitin carboxyl-terminal hydrolase 13 [Apostasia shenzhenica]|uniref:Ubiquitin carboxyl-terminal hydrolase 13 n=1 Tax=Apostasia shenzhenica TaxID=1088818 RepID=A0A2I0B1S9_9ASPA|nr:Ubiquitin carboxyl-terminal hydrolase 13 [Apostasia shenzhenica]
MEDLLHEVDMLLSASPALYGGYPDYSKEELYIAKAFGGFEGELNVKDASAYDFLWTIKSFTLLTENSKSKQSSGRFGAKGYTWKLICYPNGNLSKNHISLYVMLAKAPEQQSEAVFKVSFQLFLFDKTSGSTFSRKGESHAQAYDEIGFRNFMDLKVFRNPSKGYLVNNSCMFGVKILQVTPIKTTTECLHPVKEITHEYSCKIDSFSKLDKTTSTDKKFTAGDYICSKELDQLLGLIKSIHIHPDGDQTSDAKGKHLSLYLYYYGSVSDVSATKVSAEFTLTIIDQQTSPGIGINGWTSEEHKMLPLPPSLAMIFLIVQ